MLRLWEKGSLTGLQGANHIRKELRNQISRAPQLFQNTLRIKKKRRETNGSSPPYKIEEKKFETLGQNTRKEPALNELEAKNRVYRSEKGERFRGKKKSMNSSKFRQMLTGNHPEKPAGEGASRPVFDLKITGIKKKSSNQFTKFPRILPFSHEISSLNRQIVRFSTIERDTEGRDKREELISSFLNRSKRPPKRKTLGRTKSSDFC